LQNQRATCQVLCLHSFGWPFSAGNRQKIMAIIVGVNSGTGRENPDFWVVISPMPTDGMKTKRPARPRCGHLSCRRAIRGAQAFQFFCPPLNC
jgi:hypothetical protein